MYVPFLEGIGRLDPYRYCGANHVTVDGRCGIKGLTAGLLFGCPIIHTPDTDVGALSDQITVSFQPAMDGKALGRIQSGIQ